MTVLVTGGAGYIGSHTVLALIESGERVAVIDNLTTGRRAAVPSQVRFYEGDIADRNLLNTIHQENQITAILHFAGSIVVPESVSNPLKYYSNNTAKSRDLIQFAVDSHIRHFVFSSTAAVYGTPSEGTPLTESSPTAPDSPYGMSKLMTEHMLRDVSRAHDFVFTALRYFNVAGADLEARTGQSTPGATHLIKVACEVATGKRQMIEVYGTDYPTPDGSCVRDYIHVSDLAAAHVLALKRMREGRNSLVANCGYGHGFSVLEVLDAVQKVHGGKLDIRFSGRRPGDAVSVVAVPTLAKAELGWTPKLNDLELIIGSALRWEKTLN